MEGISTPNSNTKSSAAAAQKIIALKEVFGSSHVLLFSGELQLIHANILRLRRHRGQHGWVRT